MVAVHYTEETGLAPPPGCRICYFHKDHLGSIALITAELGTVIAGGRLSDDPWGQRRDPSSYVDAPGANPPLDRGFTGHEHLQEVALIHMNGRVYDPQLGRFLSADPFIQDVLNLQALNRYSYVLNNPLALTDPSGLFFKTLFKVFRTVPIVRAVVVIAAAVTMQHYVFPVLLSATATSFSVVVATGATAGALNAGLAGGSLGDVLKGAAIGGATAAAFHGVGTATDAHFGTGADAAAKAKDFFSSPAHFANIAGHAAVGCASAAAGGGDCASGALSGAVGAFAGLKLAGLNLAAGTAASAVLGGVSSVLGGGKFANGAVTAAFGYLYNASVEPCERMPLQPNGIIDSINVPDGFFERLARSIHADMAGAELAAFGRA
jgi:RHS repeat-associated protein